MADYATRRRAMVDTQVRPSDVTKYPIIDAMLKVAREQFVPDTKREAAYVGGNFELGAGRVILEARTLGKLFDALDIQPDEAVLDIGCGLGYSSALIANLADAVVAVESDEEMADEAQRRLSEAGADNVAVITGPLAIGDAKDGPYDVIAIQGGVQTIPGALLDQLRDGGRIGAIFIEDGVGICRIGHKIEGRVTWHYSFNASAPILSGFAKEAAFSL